MRVVSHFREPALQACFGIRPLETWESGVGFDQYHEPASELSQEIRTFARMIASLIEEAEAINWYEQRMSVEKNKQAKAIMANAQRRNSSILA